jgi:peptide deformylase
MELVHYPAEILNKQLKLVDIENIDFDPNELLKEMSDIMLGSDGVGLAACQVGIDRSLFIMGDKVAGVKMFINPQVLQHTSDTSLDYEGCLSFPGMFVKVKRPKEILVQYFDEDLVQQTVKIDDYSARVFLHEWDHLQGITFKDRVSKLKWDRAAQKKNKVAKLYSI